MKQSEFADSGFEIATKKTRKRVYLDGIDREKTLLQNCLQMADFYGRLEYA